MNKSKFLFAIPILIIAIIFLYDPQSNDSKTSDNKNIQIETSQSEPKEEILPKKDFVDKHFDTDLDENDSSEESTGPVEEVYSYTKFQEDIKYLQTNLPSPSKKREQVVKSDVHHIPDFLIKYGRVMAKMKKFVKQNPEYSAEAFDFYQECSLNNDVFVSIRSLCLFNVLELSKQLNREIDLSKYPERVLELAKSLDI